MDTYNQTALYYLARDGKTKAVELFVNKGNVKTNISDLWG